MFQLRIMQKIRDAMNRLMRGRPAANNNTHGSDSYEATNNDNTYSSASNKVTNNNNTHGSDSNKETNNNKNTHGSGSNKETDSNRSGRTSSAWAWTWARNGGEFEQECKYRLDMPGMTRNDVKIWFNVEDEVLSIEASKAPREGDNENKCWTAKSFGRYNKRIRLSKLKFDYKRIKAEIKDGVLYITIPRAKFINRMDIDVQ